MPALTGDLYSMMKQSNGENAYRLNLPTLKRNPQPATTPEEEQEEQQELNNGLPVASPETAEPSVKPSEEGREDSATDELKMPTEEELEPINALIDKALLHVQAWRGPNYTFTDSEKKALQALVYNSDDPEDAMSRFIASSALSATSGIDVGTVYSNLDAISQYYTGEEYMPAKSTSLAEKVNAGFVTIEAQNLMIEWKSAIQSGDKKKAAELETEIQAKLDSIGGIQNGLPQNWLDGVANTVLGNLGYIVDIAKTGILATALTKTALTLFAAAATNPITLPVATAAVGRFATGAAAVYTYKRTHELAAAQSFWTMMHMEGANTTDVLSATVLSELHGVVTGLTEIFLDGITSRGLGLITRNMPKNFGLSMLLNVSDAGRLNSMTMAVLDWAAGSLDEGFLNEFPQQVSDLLTQAAYKASIGMPVDLDIKEILGESFDAAIDGILVGAIYGGVQIPAGMLQHRDTAIQLRRSANAFKSREQYFEATADLKPDNISQEVFDEARNKIYDAAQQSLVEMMASEYKGTPVESVEIAEEELFSILGEEDEEGVRHEDPDAMPDGSVARLSSGRLYSEEKTAGTRTEVLFGDPEQGGVYGSVEYRVENDDFVIKSVRTRLDYTGIRPEMVTQVISDYSGGRNVVWEPSTPGLLSVRDSLVRNNPRGEGAGLNYSAPSADTASLNAAADTIQRQIPRLSRAEAVVSAQLYSMANGEGALTSRNNGRIFGDAAADGINLEGRRGATDIARSLIYAGQNADVSTFTHELFHATAAVRPAERTELTSAIKTELADTDSRQKLADFIEEHKAVWADAYDLDAIMANFESMDESSPWTRETEENLARLYEAYRSSSQSVRRSLPERIRAILNRLADYVSRIYNTLRSTTQLNERIAEAYDNLMGVQASEAEGQENIETPSESAPEPQETPVPSDFPERPTLEKDLAEMSDEEIDEWNSSAMGWHKNVNDWAESTGDRPLTFTKEDTTAFIRQNVGEDREEYPWAIIAYSSDPSLNLDYGTFFTKGDAVLALVSEDNFNYVDDNTIFFQDDLEYDPRSLIPKVRGGWTEAKILKYLKKHPTLTGAVEAIRLIKEFDSPEELKEHMFYHGTRSGDRALYPSITFSEREAERIGGGGYGERYWAISVSKSKRIASRFGGMSNSVSIYPIILAKNAVVKQMDISDSIELNDYIVDLYNEGVDAVWVGDITEESSEQELAVINPRAIVNIGRRDLYQVFGLGTAKNPLRIASDEDIQKMYDYAKAYQPIREKDYGAPNRPSIVTPPSISDFTTDDDFRQAMAEYRIARDEYDKVTLPAYNEAYRAWKNSEGYSNYLNAIRERDDAIRFQDDDVSRAQQERLEALAEDIDEIETEEDAVEVVDRLGAEYENYEEEFEEDPDFVPFDESEDGKENPADAEAAFDLSFEDWDSIVGELKEESKPQNYLNLPGDRQLATSYEEMVADLLPAVTYSGSETAKDNTFADAMKNLETFKAYMAILGESLTLNTVDKNGYKEGGVTKIEPFTDQMHREQIQRMVEQRLVNLDVKYVARMYNTNNAPADARVKRAQSEITKNARIYRDLFADLTGDKSMKPTSLTNGRLAVNSYDGSGGYKSINELAKIVSDAQLNEVASKLKSGTLKMKDVDDTMLKNLQQTIATAKKQTAAADKMNAALSENIKALEAQLKAVQDEAAKTDENIKTALYFLETTAATTGVKLEGIAKEYTDAQRKLDDINSRSWYVKQNTPEDGRKARGRKYQYRAEEAGDKQWRAALEKNYGLTDLKEIKAAKAELEARLPELRARYLKSVSMEYAKQVGKAKQTIDNMQKAINDNKNLKSSKTITELKRELASVKNELTLAQNALNFGNTARYGEMAKMINHLEYINKKNQEGFEKRLNAMRNRGDELLATLKTERSESRAEIRRLQNELRAAEKTNEAQRDRLSKQAQKMNETIAAMTRQNFEEKENIRRKNREWKALQEIRDEKVRIARSIMAPVSYNTIDWEAAGEAIVAIQALIDNKFRRDWIYSLATNLEGEVGGETMRFEEAIKYFGELDAAGKQRVRDAVNPAILARLTGQVKPLNDWTVEELRALAEQVDELRSIGRRVFAAKQAFQQEQAKRLVGRMLDSLGDKSRANIEKLSQSVEDTKQKRGIQETIRSGMFATRRMQELAQFVDGGYGNYGAAFQLLVEEKRYHQDRERRAIESRLSKINPYLDKKTVEALLEEVEIDLGDTKATFTVDQLAYVWLSQYEEKNRAAVAYGNLLTEDEKGTWINKGKDKITKEDIVEFISGANSIVDDNILQYTGDKRYEKLLNASSFAIDDRGLWDVVNAIKNDFASQGRRLQKMSIEVFNHPISLVDHYLPIKRADLTGEDLAHDVADALFNTNNSGILHNPEKGFTIKRTYIPPRHQKPVNMSLLSVWQQSVTEQEHLIEFGTYMKKLHRVFNDRLLSARIQGAYGTALYKEITDYIDLLANPTRGQRKTGAEKAVKTLRGNLAAAYLGFKASGIVMQGITSPWPFLSELNPAQLAGAYMKIGAHPVQVLKEIGEKSSMMKNRSMNQVYEELMQRSGRITQGKWSKRLNAFQQIGMTGLEYVDKYAVAGGWLAKYTQVLRESLNNNMSTEEAEAAAVKAADDLVLKVQPTGDATEMASMFRTKNEYAKALLQFTSSLNVIWNNISADLKGHWKNHEYFEVVGTIVGYLGAGLLMGLIMEGFDDDDEPSDKVAKGVYWMTTQFTDSVPWLGSTVNGIVQQAFTGEQDYYGFSSVFPAFDKFAQAVKGASNLDVGKAAKGLGEGIGLMVGLPVSGSKQFIKAITGEPESLIGR